VSAKELMAAGYTVLAGELASTGLQVRADRVCLRRNSSLRNPPLSGDVIQSPFGNSTRRFSKPSLAHELVVEGVTFLDGSIADPPLYSLDHSA
jgi:hypothetical protein